MRKSIAIVAAICFLAACATTDPESEPELVEAAVAVSDEPNGLPAQTLGKDECGLFLWSQADISRFIFFAKAGEETALFLMNNEPTELSTVSVGGDIFGQFFTQSSYASASGSIVDLSFEAGDELIDGARISSGSIQFSDSDGWRTVLPVLGARVCQPYSANTENAPASATEE